MKAKIPRRLDNLLYGSLKTVRVLFNMLLPGAHALDRARADFEAMRNSFLISAAEQLNLRWTELPNGVIRVTHGQMVACFRGGATDLDGPASLQVAGDKTLTAKLLEETNIPIPAHIEVRAGALFPALRFQRQHTDIVIKPASGTSRAAGITMRPNRYGKL